jgi:hypothetical protein
MRPMSSTQLNARQRANRDHVKRLKAVLEQIVEHDRSAELLRSFAADAIRRGFPVETLILSPIDVPTFVLETEARYATLAFPSLRHLHGKARTWLEVKTKKCVPDGSLAFNIALGGTVIA